ncbi:superoxide dismutase [Labilibacter sediminis]|nr:superoxide dismutase [Labilibacter sediminis]
MERRKFITIAGVSMLSAFVAPGLTNCKTKNSTQVFKGHLFDELPYAFSALEPYIDAETMELHYSKHHKGYYKKFMAAIKGSALENMPIEDIFKNIDKYDEGVRNNGGGYYNHSLFWKNLSPDGGEPGTKLLNAITDTFGSLNDFKAAFNHEAKTQFGSGWAWLVISRNGNLSVGNTANQNNPLMPGEDIQGIPLIAFDVWEHAYYLKYQNKRTEYIDSFWNIINWKEVNQRYEVALNNQ